MLDRFQEAFCASSAKDVRLLAPAGSGKTLSLLYRCKALSERTEGRRFLIVTFTRAARDELKARLKSKDFAALSNIVDVTTLNSWGWRRVRERHHSPKLLGQKDRHFAVQNSLQPIWKKDKRVCAAMEKKPVPTGKLILNALDQLKNLAFDHSRMKTPALVSAHAERLADAGADGLLPVLAADLHAAGIISANKVERLISEFIPFFRDATASLIAQSVFTLDDQKYVAYLNIREQIDEKRFPLGGSKFSDIVIDEFQDISPLDLALLLAITDLHRAGMTIVGDDDQAIFEWRGATPSYILHPDRWLGRNFDTFVLERNYRCPKNLVEHSERLIRYNKNRYPKKVEARHTRNAAISVETKRDFAESIDHVVDRVVAFCESETSENDRIALVSRKRAQLIPYQIVLAQRGINFCAAEDLQVFLSDSFDTLIHMLTTRLNAEKRQTTRAVAEDLVALCDKVRRFPLSKADRLKLLQHLASCKPKTSLEGLAVLAKYRGTLKGENTGGKMSASFADAVRELLEADTVCAAIDAISEHFSGMSKDYGRAEEDIFYADPPFFYLSRFAERYEDDFETFLDDLETAASTLAHVPPDDEAIFDAWSRPVHLMTAIRAKGKEFHTVVLLDANDGIWPMRQAQTQAQLEGERRVFYVAMTRAKAELVITVSERIGSSSASPSPYLAEAKLIPTLA